MTSVASQSHQHLTTMTIIVRTHVSHHGDEMTTTRTKLTRQEAAQRLQVSESTLDRMIRRGDLAVEREGHGSRYRIWVLLDNDGEQPSYSANGHNADSRDYSRATTADKIEQAHYGTDYSDDHELTALRAEVRSLRELSDYRAELLKDSEWRYHELLQQLNMCQEQLKLSQETTATPRPCSPCLQRRCRDSSITTQALVAIWQVGLDAA